MGGPYENLSIKRNYIFLLCHFASNHSTMFKRFQFILLQFVLSAAEENTNFDCHSSRNAFSEEQKLFCQRHPEVMPYLVHGATDALRFCSREMAAEQWDCSPQRFEGDGRAIYVQDDGGSREAALLTAVRAAGMVDALILAYWNNELASPFQGHIDDTYLDIVKRAKNLVTEFLSFDDLPPRKTDGWYVAQHNANIGLTVVERLITCDDSDPRARRCGAGLTHFTWVAERLHDLYDDAVRVKVHRRPRRILSDHHFEELSTPKNDRSKNRHHQNRNLPSRRRKRQSYALKSQLDGSAITNGKLDVDAQTADVDFPNIVFLDDLKLYYVVDSPTIVEYCRDDVIKRGRTCFRQWTRRTNRSWSQYSTPFIRRAIKACRRLCCNHTLQDVRVRYNMRGDDSITMDHVCP
uniref:Protein Wnt n=1 Tax=Romanomermis culicivorax TaxID=13658 RepID=A0A915JX93_ROMCU